MLFSLLFFIKENFFFLVFCYILLFVERKFSVLLEVGFRKLLFVLKILIFEEVDGEDEEVRLLRDFLFIVNKFIIGFVILFYVFFMLRYCRDEDDDSLFDMMYLFFLKFVSCFIVKKVSLFLSNKVMILVEFEKYC